MLQEKWISSFAPKITSFLQRIYEAPREHPCITSVTLELPTETILRENNKKDILQIWEIIETEVRHNLTTVERNYELDVEFNATFSRCIMMYTSPSKNPKA